MAAKGDTETNQVPELNPFSAIMNSIFPAARRCTCFLLGLAVAGLVCKGVAADNGVRLASPILNKPAGFTGTLPTLGSRAGGIRLAQPSTGAAQGFFPGPLPSAPSVARANPVPVPSASLQSFKQAAPATGPVLGPLYIPSEKSLPLSQSDGNLTVSVPSGFFQVTLETSAGGGWKPVDTRHLNGTEQIVTFTLPAGASLDTLRARAVTTDKFSGGQWQGEDTFAWQDGTQSSGTVATDTQINSVALTGSAMTLSASASTNAVTSLAATSTTAATLSTTTTAAAATPAAVESDIWKVIGNRLFFFNQYRGMQVFDLTDPAHPVKTGALRMAAVGELFYALDDQGSSLALLARNNTRNQALGISMINVLTVSPEGRPTLAKQLPLDGYVADSRLLGSKLYVLLSNWSYSGSKVTLVGYDLSSPQSPVSLGSLDLPRGYYLTLQAAGPYLMVSSSTSGGWWYYGSASHVSVIDTSDASGLKLVKTVNTTGYLADQFKMNIDGDTLTTVSQAWAQGDLISNYWGSWYSSIRQTWVETFSLSSPDSTPVGRMKIDKADGEELYATRFDGKRLYVVTYFQRDPLFIIDLQDPANPQIKGELVTPGWSTYIAPQGDRLLTVGIDNSSTSGCWKVCVSWFDVSDVTSPQLLSRVYPGDGVHSTWSEAIYDHKAVNWVQEQGKIFVPFEMWNYTNWTFTSATQVISLANDALALEIAIPSQGNARRGDVINGCLVSISGQQMVITTDPVRGDPQEKARLELSWPVDRMVALDHYLVQVEDGSQNGWWGWMYTSTQEAVLRLSDKADPDTVLDSVSLGKGRIVGVTRRGDSIYVGQIVPSDADHPDALMQTWAIIVDGAGRLQKFSSVSTIINPSYYWSLEQGNVRAAWVSPDTFVWHVPATSQWGCWAWNCFPVCVYASTTNSTGQQSAGPVCATLPQGELCALVFPVAVGLEGGLTAGDVVDVHAPVGGGVLSVGKPFADHGFLFFSEQRCWYYNCWGNYGFCNSILVGPVSHCLIATDCNVVRLMPCWPCYGGSGYSGSLHVLDFRQGLKPVVRDPVSLAGSLIAVASADANGAYLMTSRTSYYGWDGEDGQRLTSLAYDGVRAHKIDTMRLDYGYVTDSAGSEAFFTNDDWYAPTVTAVGLTDTGRLRRISSWTLNQMPYDLKVVDNYLFASGWGDFEVAQIVPGGALAPQASLDLPTCIWFNLDRSVLDPVSPGLWLPAGDYGVEYFGLGK